MHIKHIYYFILVVISINFWYFIGIGLTTDALYYNECLRISSLTQFDRVTTTALALASTASRSTPVRRT